MHCIKQDNTRKLQTLLPSHLTVCSPQPAAMARYTMTLACLFALIAFAAGLSAPAGLYTPRLVASAAAELAACIRTISSLTELMLHLPL